MAFLFGGIMEQLEKLKVMLCCWIKHNNEHAKIYMDWAGKVSSTGNEELSRTLVRLYMEQKRLNRRFEEAKKMID
jgi:hypothetical protein